MGPNCVGLFQLVLELKKVGSVYAKRRTGARIFKLGAFRSRGESEAPKHEGGERPRACLKGGCIYGLLLVTVKGLQE